MPHVCRRREPSNSGLSPSIFRVLSFCSTVKTINQHPLRHQIVFLIRGLSLSSSLTSFLPLYLRFDTIDCSPSLAPALAIVTRCRRRHHQSSSPSLEPSRVLTRSEDAAPVPFQLHPSIYLTRTQSLHLHYTTCDLYRMDRQCRAHHMCNVTRHCRWAICSGVESPPITLSVFASASDAVACVLPVEGVTEKRHGPVEGPVDSDAHDGGVNIFRYISCLRCHEFCRSVYVA